MERSWYAKVPAIAWIATVPLYAGGLLAPNLPTAWILLMLANALAIVWLGPIIAAVQHLAPRHMRSTASASFLLINNLIGLGVGPLLMGAISDWLKGEYGTESLRYAAVSCLGFYILAALLALLSVRALRRDWVAEAPAG